MHLLLIALIAAGLVALAIATAPAFNANFVPTPQDNLLQIENAITETATYAGTTFTWPGTLPPILNSLGMPAAVVVNLTNAGYGSANETYAFKVQESADGETWTDASPTYTPPVAATGAYGAFSIGCFLSQQYVRLSVTIAGTSPTCTYSAWINQNLGGVR